MNTLTRKAEFAFTPDLVRWIVRHAGDLNEHDMAALLKCSPGTLRNICRKFAIGLCSASNKHAEIDAPPAVLPPAKVHARLDPALRGNRLGGYMELRPQRNAVAVIDRKAAELRTTPSILAAVILEIVATENMFDAVLDLE
jgi:hypothetical protein